MNAILETLLSNTILAGLMAFALTLGGRFIRTPALRHLLWMLVLVKLITPPLWRVPITGILPALPQEAVLREEEMIEARPEKEPVVRSSVNDPALAIPSGTGKSAGPAAPAILVTLLLVGAMGMLGLAMGRALRFGKWVNRAEPAEEPLQRTARKMAEKLRVRGVPRVLVAAGTIPPLLWRGVRRAVILLPSGLVTRLSPGELETIIAHEMAHLRRGDTWWRWIEILILGVQWWNPVAWWARRQVRQAEELCCDAWVVWAIPDCGRAYAGALLKTMEFLSPQRGAAPSPACAVVQTRQFRNTRDRFEAILRGPRRPCLRHRQRVMAGLLAALLLPVCGLSVRSQDDPARSVLSERNASAEKGGIEERLDRLEQLFEQALRQRNDGERQLRELEVRISSREPKYRMAYHEPDGDRQDRRERAREQYARTEKALRSALQDLGIEATSHEQASALCQERIDALKQQIKVVQDELLAVSEGGVPREKRLAHGAVLDRLGDALRAQAELLVQHSPEHPRVVAAGAMVRAAAVEREALEREFPALTNNLPRALANQKLKLELLRRDWEVWTKRAALLSDMEVRLSAYERELSMKRKALDEVERGGTLEAVTSEKLEEELSRLSNRTLLRIRVERSAPAADLIRVMNLAKAASVRIEAIVEDGGP